MKIFKHKINLQKELISVKNLSFVPTMGGLHKGHEYLISQSRKKGKKVLVSIYVNPKQFNSKNDYLSYPRNLKKDINILKKLKIDYLYTPKFNDLYNFKPKKKVFLHNFSKKLCGKHRKGHFNGVLNVVNRMVEIINPKYIYLGMKDFQQLYLIKKHIINSKISTKVIGCRTIRNKFGVAESSRNINLNKKDMNIASNVYQYLKKQKKILISKKINKLNSFFLKKKIYSLGVKKIDYIDFFNNEALEIKTTNNEFNIFIAYYINDVRLIDNI